MSWKRALPALLVCTLPVLACEDDSVEVDDDFDLTFQGDATFGDAHADQAIAVAVVDDAGAVISTMNGTVSASADPAFSFEFADILQLGQTYDVHYWIDSNFGGGTAGVCDPPQTDHQWSVDVATVAGDVTITEDHQPADVTGVCDSF